MTNKIFSVLISCLFFSCASTPTYKIENDKTLYFPIDITIEEIKEEEWIIPYKDSFIITLTRSDKEVRSWITEVNKKYKRAGVEFYLRNYTKKPFTKGFTFNSAAEEGNKVKDAIYVYYFCFPNDYFSGISSFPWQPLNNVIFMTWNDRNPETLAHELGHWMGLYHIFDQDQDIRDVKYYSRDTPECLEYPNIMNYTLFDLKDQFFTDGQIQRIRENAIKYRLAMIHDRIF